MATGETDRERAVLQGGPLGALSDDVLDALLRRSSRRLCVGGETIFDRGEHGSCAYVVLHGRARVIDQQADTDASHVIAEIGPGELVGEMALLGGGRRSALVVAVRDSELLVIDDATFGEVIERDVVTLRHVAELIVNRATAERAPASPPSIVTVVVDGPDSEWVGDELGLAFERAGHRVLGVHTSEPPALASVVQRAETGPELVVLTARADDLDWAETAVRQADVVLPVASHRTSRSCAAVIEWLKDRTHRPRVESIAISSTPAPPASLNGAARRHRSGGPNACRSDLDRITRLISGAATTLVLGSGSARGLAHVGVLQAFEERGIAVDAIGGTSAGSIVAGMWAAGRSIGRIRDDFVDFIDRVRWSRDLIVPRYSILSGRQLSDAIERYFEATRFEELGVDLFAVSTDLGTGTAVVHDEGLVWRALRASASIPGVFPPVRDGDRLLADGAIVDRLPVTTMRERHPGSIVWSVDLATPTGLSAAGHAADGRTTWRQAVMPEATTRGIGPVMGRVVELTGSTDDAGDVTIRPVIGELSLRDGAGAIDAAISAGRRAALDALAVMAAPI